MTDVHQPLVRSFNMSKIRSKDTKPELLIRKFLHSKGFRYRLHKRSLPGTPDLVLPRYNTVIFIHGCFWHGHTGCKYFIIPGTRSNWWAEKIGKNQKKDNESIALLRNAGWNVIVIWECELKSEKRDRTLQRLIEQLSG